MYVKYVVPLSLAALLGFSNNAKAETSDAPPMIKIAQSTAKSNYSLSSVMVYGSCNRPGSRVSIKVEHRNPYSGYVSYAYRDTKCLFNSIFATIFLKFELRANSIYASGPIRVTAAMRGSSYAYVAQDVRYRTYYRGITRFVETVTKVWRDSSVHRITLTGICSVRGAVMHIAIFSGGPNTYRLVEAKCNYLSTYIVSLKVPKAEYGFYAAFVVESIYVGDEADGTPLVLRSFRFNGFKSDPGLTYFGYHFTWQEIYKHYFEPTIYAIKDSVEAYASL